MLIKNLIDIYLRHSSEVSVFLSFGWFHILSAFFWGGGGRYKLISLAFVLVTLMWVHKRSDLFFFEIQFYDFPFSKLFMNMVLFVRQTYHTIVYSEHHCNYDGSGWPALLAELFFLKKFICSSNPLSVRLPVSHMYAWFLHFRIILTCLMVSLTVCFKSS